MLRTSVTILTGQTKMKEERKMSKAAKGNDDFELSADELAKQEGRPKPTLVKKGGPVEQDPQQSNPPKATSQPSGCQGWSYLRRLS
jgi:hypothetical protein